MNTAPLRSARLQSTPPQPGPPPAGPPYTGPSPAGTPTAPGAPSAPGTAPADPRLGWTATGDDHAPTLQHRRDGILPAIAAALSVRGQTLTSTAHKGDQGPAPHPLVQDFLDTLATEHRTRHTGRCPETVLLSRFLTSAEDTRTAKRTHRRTTVKPRQITHSEARRALKHSKITARHIREDGDPLHGRYAPPCRTCAALLAHFGVRPVDPAAAAEATT